MKSFYITLQYKAASYLKSAKILRNVGYTLYTRARCQPGRNNHILLRGILLLFSKITFHRLIHVFCEGTSNQY